ncbi:MAG TPA: HipA domain-containing protein, partial [Planctomycetota bacterium]|nr:HipA domain-containing protein [Planctomycetota bacterium]
MTALEGLKRLDRADVWLPGSHCASLTRETDGVSFSYLPGYRGPPVATSLPVRSDPVRAPAGAVPPFFAGLLPEGRRLAAIRRAVKTSADDELTLLLAVGSDTIGNVQVLPPGEPARPLSTVNVGRLEDVEFAELFESVLTPAHLDRTAIPGIQDKVSGSMIALPLAYGGAGWILKLAPAEFPHLVVNEAFFLDAARRSGLEVAHAEVVHDKIGTPGLLVRRFDREVVAGKLVATAQEDACQVLDRYPADKYRLTTESVIDGLARLTHAPVVAARSLLRQFAFAYLTCNGDAHAKNFSVIRRSDGWEVAPAYDLPSTHV